MKKLIKISLLTLLVSSFTQCASDDSLDQSIIGRWVLLGFEDTIRYDFTADKRFTIYGDGSGDFPTLDEFRAQNPNLPGLDWYYEGDTVVVDLNFGNFSKLIPNFKCGNSVIDWTSTDNTLHSTYYREGHDISKCD